MRIKIYCSIIVFPEYVFRNYSANLIHPVDANNKVPINKLPGPEGYFLI